MVRDCRRAQGLLNLWLGFVRRFDFLCDIWCCDQALND